MSQRKKDLLLSRYFKQGWLARRYYDGSAYRQLYSASDRLWAGECFYTDFVLWQRASFSIKAVDFSLPKTDGGVFRCDGAIGADAERFRQALRRLSKTNLPVLYKIVLEEQEIIPPKSLTERERLYFNDEIKGLLCRGLDELISFYKGKFCC